FKPNSLHIFDLAGNVAEWCEDEWPDTRQERVIRGSSWRTGSTQELLSSARRHMKETAAEPDVGFRIVLVNQHP
ncbi:MAG: SUMF1/EgtB/PvdO family nonheme iron enzyme, partial [Verrucomicrobiaceae bacterium]